MDFIETWLGLSPDGGDGTTEALYIVAAGAILAVLVAGLRGSSARQRARRRARGGV